MKQVGRFVAQVTAFGMAAAAALVLSAQAGQGSAIVNAIPQGTAQYTTDGASWQGLVAGADLNAGSTIKTDSEGIVDLTLKPSNSMLRVSPSSTVTLGTISSEDTGAEKITVIELQLTSGRLLGTAAKSSSLSRFDIKTQVGTVSVKEGWFDVSASGRASVIKGFAEVKYNAPGAPAPTTFNVKAGETFEPTLNNNQGGVIRTPAEDLNWAKQQIASLMSSGMGPGKVPIARPLIKAPEQPALQTPTVSVVEGYQPPPSEIED